MATKYTTGWAEQSRAGQGRASFVATFTQHINEAFLYCIHEKYDDLWVSSITVAWLNKGGKVWSPLNGHYPSYTTSPALSYDRFVYVDWPSAEDVKAIQKVLNTASNRTPLNILQSINPQRKNKKIVQVWYSMSRPFVCHHRYYCHCCCCCCYFTVH